jgi:hypothetical protein
VVELAASDLTDAAAMLRAIQRELPGLVTTTGAGDVYLFFDPDRVRVPEQRFPFCTLMPATGTTVRRFSTATTRRTG